MICSGKLIKFLKNNLCRYFLFCEDTKGNVRFREDLYMPANDPGTANEPQIGRQMIPGPEMIPASDIAEK